MGYKCSPCAFQVPQMHRELCLKLGSAECNMMVIFVLEPKHWTTSKVFTRGFVKSRHHCFCALTPFSQIPKNCTRGVIAHKTKKSCKWQMQNLVQTGAQPFILICTPNLQSSKGFGPERVFFTTHHIFIALHLVWLVRVHHFQPKFRQSHTQKKLGCRILKFFVHQAFETLL